MSDKKLTPLQMAIDIICGEIRAIKKTKTFADDELKQNLDIGKVQGFEQAKQILTDLLPTERECIEKAFNNGWEVGYAFRDVNGDDYFTETFKTD